MEVIGEERETELQRLALEKPDSTTLLQVF
jgi:hypothetical protein